MTDNTVPTAKEYDSFGEWVKDGIVPSGVSCSVTLKVNDSAEVPMHVVVAALKPGFYLVGWLESHEDLDEHLDTEKHARIQIGADGEVLDLGQMSSIGPRMWFGPYPKLQDIDFDELEAALDAD